jgi:hypothetical protein
MHALPSSRAYDLIPIPRAVSREEDEIATSICSADAAEESEVIYAVTVEVSA